MTFIRRGCCKPVNIPLILIGKMKILFLDVDGVLNSEESFLANHEKRCQVADAAGKQDLSAFPEYCWPMGHLSRPLIARLNMIVENTGCFIVLSSSWRVICKLSEFRGWLRQKGFLFPDKIIDKTDNNPDEARGGQIQRWLDCHPEVTKYAILDDDSEDIIGSYTTKKHPNNFVQTEWNWGLQEKQVNEVADILNK